MEDTSIRRVISSKQLFIERESSGGFEENEERKKEEEQKQKPVLVLDDPQLCSLLLLELVLVEACELSVQALFRCLIR